MTYAELKAFIKANAAKITELKKTRKGSPNGYVAGLDSLRYETRHFHIAHCLLRGKTIDQIEKPAENNKHNEYYVKQVMARIVFPPKKEFMEGSNAEAICDCQG